MGFDSHHSSLPSTIQINPKTQNDFSRASTKQNPHIKAQLSLNSARNSYYNIMGKEGRTRSNKFWAKTQRKKKGKLREKVKGKYLQMWSKIPRFCGQIGKEKVGDECRDTRRWESDLGRERESHIKWAFSIADVSLSPCW